VTWRLALCSNFSLKLVSGAVKPISTGAYNKEQTCLRSIVVVVDHGIWQQNRLKKLTSLFSLPSHWFIYQYQLNGFYFHLKIAIAMVNIMAMVVNIMAVVG
jgi:hypothetical protein